MLPPTVLLITDDRKFARALLTRWQEEPQLPALTQVQAAVASSMALEKFRFILVGPVQEKAGEAVKNSIENSGVAACACSDAAADWWPANGREDRWSIPHRDGWLDTVVLLSREVLRRFDAEWRVRWAEDAEARSGVESTLGRYMLEMSHGITDALTSLLGNADLLLLSGEGFSGQSREQIRTIQTMSLRLHEIMLHFSSLASEAAAAEKDSHTETGPRARGRISDIG